MPDPFGERSTPWRRRIWQRDDSSSPPRRYSLAAGAVGALAGRLLPSTHGIDRLEEAVIFALVTGLPPCLLARWWKQRRREQAEQLLVLPSAAHDDRAPRLSIRV